jgi:hypothetical protein
MNVKNNGAYGGTSRENPIRKCCDPAYQPGLVLEQKGFSTAVYGEGVPRTGGEGTVKNPFESMKAYWICYEMNEDDRRFIIYVDPTGELTRDQINGFVAQSQGIAKKKVHIGEKELERSITPNAFLYDDLYPMVEEDDG